MKPLELKNYLYKKKALAWAEKQLPDIQRKRLKTEFESLESSNGKKAPVWVEYIHQLAKS